MILYHSTNCRLVKLVPTFGENRHNGEDIGAKGRPVIYLTNDKENISRENGVVYRYRYSIEVNKNESDLYEDENLPMI